MKIYVVLWSSMYDSMEWNINTIFLNKDKAEEYIVKQKKMKDIRSDTLKIEEWDTED